MIFSQEGKFHKERSFFSKGLNLRGFLPLTPTPLPRNGGEGLHIGQTLSCDTA